MKHRDLRGGASGDARSAKWRFCVPTSPLLGAQRFLPSPHTWVRVCVDGYRSGTGLSSEGMGGD
jgi:hypothetical protein